MPVIRADDLAFVRFRAPDLDAMEAFLTDFGLVRAARDGDRLHMRGTGPDAFAHVTQRGPAGFAGLAFEATEADLEALARATGRPVEPLEEPGGGSVVRLADPDGFAVEAVARPAAAPLPLPERAPVNDARVLPRRDAVKRVASGPSHVKRLGHVVLNVKDFRESERWYKAHFGLVTSDEIALGPEMALGAFLRCDRGDKPADHHTLFLVGTGAPKFGHAAFEVADMDDLMAGHDHLTAKGRSAEWGVGRHILGSQIFDYWRDPWGHALEHWTDGDVLTASFGSRTATVQDLMGVQWGPPMPPTMA